jgi:hypothetical protein
MKYELVEIEPLFSDVPFIIRREDENGEVWLIPFDEANTMYQQYLVDTDGGLPLPEKTKEDK